MKTIAIAVFLFFSLLLAISQADCEYNGQIYPTGTTINGKTCQPDGSWD